jgi:hypothetical protein
MQFCPTCKQSFEDEIVYCIFDGSTLTAAELPRFPNTINELPSAGLSSSSAASFNRLYLVIGIMGAVIITLLLSLFIPRLIGGNNVGGKSTSALTVFGSGLAVDTIATQQSFKTPQAMPEIRLAKTASPIPEPTAAPTINFNPDGKWSGQWSVATGTLLDFDLTLRSNGANGVQGQIKWTMRRTVRPDKMDKIGLPAIEYVRGSFDPSSGQISLSGYAKDDPNNVLVMVDDYRLRLSADSRRLSGAARNGGRWNGQISLTR